MKAVYFFTRKPGVVKENRSEETQSTQQTEESTLFSEWDVA